MRFELKFTGEINRLDDLLSTLRYKYRDDDFEINTDCVITVTQIEKATPVINPVEFSPVESM